MKKVLLFFFISVGVIAQNINKEKLDKYFLQLQNNNKVLGSSAVLKDGNIVYQNAIGYADLAAKRSNIVNTKFRVGSISKTFTTVLIFKAIEDGKLTLETSLDKFFPTVKNSSSITIKNLLNHSSGIFNFTNSSDYMKYYTSAKSREELLQIINKYDSDFKPGSKHSYSNSNFVLLSFILEDVFKSNYASILQKYIAKPLQLKNTYVGGKLNVSANECKSYNYAFKNWNEMPETDMSIPLGAGAVVSTPSDLLTFIDALFNEKLITKHHVDLMTTIENDYGLGIFKYPFGKQYGFGHGGGIDGFKSILMYFPEKKIGIATTTNGIGPDFQLNSLSLVLLRAANNIDFSIPDFKEIKVDVNILKSYEGIYASKDMPLKITVKEEEGKLSAQATGQSSFLLTSKSNTQFTYSIAGIVLDFNSEKSQMILKQGGGVYTFTKQ
ncbi:MAG: beta-lactamase family protein [Tenacibaculum sp.]|nr:beta-lactamase family protein [Tenacibaculum sp.]